MVEKGTLLIDCDCVNIVRYAGVETQESTSLYYQDVPFWLT
jgi:hypothetical protein